MTFDPIGGPLIPVYPLVLWSPWREIKRLDRKGSLGNPAISRPPRITR